MWTWSHRRGAAAVAMPVATTVQRSTHRKRCKEEKKEEEVLPYAAGLHKESSDSALHNVSQVFFLFPFTPS